MSSCLGIVVNATTCSMGRGRIIMARHVDSQRTMLRSSSGCGLIFKATTSKAGEEVSEAVGPVNGWLIHLTNGGLVARRRGRVEGVRTGLAPYWCRSLILVLWLYTGRADPGEQEEKQNHP